MLLSLSTTAVIVAGVSLRRVSAMSEAIQFWDDADCVRAGRIWALLKLTVGGRFGQCDKGNSRPRDGFVSAVHGSLPWVSFSLGWLVDPVMCLGKAIR